MSIDEKVLEMARDCIDPRMTVAFNVGHTQVESLARALLDAHEEIGRMRAVYEAAVKWRSLDPLAGEDLWAAHCRSVDELRAAIDAARGEGK